MSRYAIIPAASLSAEEAAGLGSKFQVVTLDGQFYVIEDPFTVQHLHYINSKGGVVFSNNAAISNYLNEQYSHEELPQ